MNICIFFTFSLIFKIITAYRIAILEQNNLKEDSDKINLTVMWMLTIFAVVEDLPQLCIQGFFTMRAGIFCLLLLFLITYIDINIVINKKLNNTSYFFLDSLLFIRNITRYKTCLICFRYLIFYTILHCIWLSRAKRRDPIKMTNFFLNIVYLVTAKFS